MLVWLGGIASEAIMHFTDDLCVRCARLLSDGLDVYVYYIGSGI